jgi:hypothetical protein
LAGGVVATPSPRERSLATYDWGGLHVRDWVTTNYAPIGSTLLDVGAGWGKYRDLLPEYVMDACEIWPDNVRRENLYERYRNVFVGDIYDVVHGRAWGRNHRYTVAILGDVLEHLPSLRAQSVIAALVGCCSEVLVVVPFLYVQDEVDGNLYERHEQDDLTQEVMAQRYRELTLLDVEWRNGRPFKGFYLGRTDIT